MELYNNMKIHDSMATRQGVGCYDQLDPIPTMYSSFVANESLRNEDRTNSNTRKSIESRKSNDETRRDSVLSGCDYQIDAMKKSYRLRNLTILEKHAKILMPEKVREHNISKRRDHANRSGMS